MAFFFKSKAKTPQDLVRMVKESIGKLESERSGTESRKRVSPPAHSSLPHPEDKDAHRDVNRPTKTSPSRSPR